MTFPHLHRRAVLPLTVVFLLILPPVAKDAEVVLTMLGGEEIYRAY